MPVKRGCLIVALGTPASPEPNDIRQFLKAFLSDRAVVDFPRWLWKPILNHIVLRVRPEKVAPTYREIWMNEGSPLEVYTKAQCELLAAALPDIEVKYAMTYTEPSISAAISEFTAEEVIIIPLYPQYAPSTVADIYRQVEILQAQKDAPRLKIVPQWPDFAPYIAWYRSEIAAAIAAERPDRIVFSYHGVPQRKVHHPESYKAQCMQTTAAIMRDFSEVPYEISFQSKFGPGKWLAPATIERMAELPGAGVENILLITPGFLVDCIETIDELDVLNQEVFKKSGGKKYSRLAPLNADAQAGNILAQLYLETAGKD
ncbi:ferrochelatase [Arcanobacterium hippocoleae]|uniref:ferrochelatase n=1 Tax=Arcanobacterium hippocoleae TaxID=149017 RepID=UPI00333EC893